MNNILELYIIKLLLNNNYYNKYNIYINREYYRNNYPEIYKILSVVDNIHHRLEDRDFSVDDLEAAFFIANPAMKAADREFYISVFNKLRSTEIDEDIALQSLEMHKKRTISFEIAKIAFEVSEGKRDYAELESKISKLDLSLASPEEVPFVSDDLEELFEHTVKERGLRWRTHTLNKMLGSLRKGDFGFLFARPEVGKTTFLASEVSYMAEQLHACNSDKYILHFNNEESGDRVKIRYYQATLGLTVDELFANRKHNTEEYLKRTGGRIKIYDQASIHRRQVEMICKQYNPGLIIFDSIDKLKGWKEDRDDLVYKEIYQWARELAKEYCPVIGVCHAAASGEGKRYLTMDDVAYAKTAKQGEADWILGIGYSGKEGMEFIRHLHASKNKLLGDEDSDSELRHGKVDVLIQPEIARYADLIDWSKS